MGEKERCFLFLFALFLATTPEGWGQHMDDTWMDQQNFNMEHQSDPALSAYVPKHLKARYGTQLKMDDSEDYGSAEAGGGPQLHSRIFSGGSDASFRKGSYTKTSSGAGGASKTKFESGEVSSCQGRPLAPKNSGMRCLSYSGCRAKCMNGYEFPHGESTVYITCQAGEWRVEGSDFTAVPNCRPICLPACQNNGICTGPNMCNCPENFLGAQCQFEKKPCLNYPVLPPNSRRACSSKACTITCAAGYQFPDGSAIANMVCREGMWVPSRPDWVSIPNCEPVCEPNCQNGGICLAYGMCQCPLEFTGPQCQYRMDACSAKKLAFNGGYSCSGNAETFSCNISCPEEVPFEFPPTSLYVCRYETGVFEPTPIPQCVFAPNAQVIRHGPTSTFAHSNEYREGYSGYSSQHTMENAFNFSGFGGGHARNGMGSFGRHGMDAFDQQNLGYIIPQTTVMEKKPEPGVCYTWGGNHYKSFDGKVFSFDSDCTFTLVRDKALNTFSINLVHTEGQKSLQIFSNDKEYILKLNDVGIPVFEVGGRRLAIPSQLSGITTEFIAHFVVAALTGVGVSVMWDAKDFVVVGTTEVMWNKTAGLCGRLDGHLENDFENKESGVSSGVSAFINSWQVSRLGEACISTPDDEQQCPLTSPFAMEADNFCSKLFAGIAFTKCKSIIETKPYFDACTSDYCKCKQENKETCACETMAVYVRECNRASKGAVSGWRDDNTCPKKCVGGRVFMPCGPKRQPVCGASALSIPGEQTCEEGCYCPKGTVLDSDGACIPKSQCPCQLRGKTFQAGAVIPKDCNTCSCVDGQWVCTQVVCGARCAAVGDPHYITFDGKRYDFMGKCSYYLVKGENYSIEAENVACAGSVSQSLGMAFNAGENPSCTKAVMIRMGNQVIKLKQNGEVLVDGTEVTSLPITVLDAYIHVVSSIFLMVEMPNGLKVWWDGASRAYIDAPASFQGRTKGLCGTFNLNQKDDFLTPEGDVEQSPVSFANKWKTHEKCDNTDDKVSNHPCDVNIQNKAMAEKHCMKIRGPLFEKCHWFVAPEPFYEDCRFDLCSCQSKVDECMCPIFAAYAKECAAKGVKIDWRNNVRECGVHCPGGQKYSICGNTCTRSCFDIAAQPDCHSQCVEGCNCEEGHTLGRNGDCIPVTQCPCVHNGIEYDPGFREIRPGNRGLETCTCTKALWDCRLATPIEVLEYPKTENIKSACNKHHHQKFTQCEPMEPVTCQNMHNPPKSSPAICRAGCVCVKGYVLDSYTKECIKPTECPCHHGGQSYKEGQTMQEDCNTCTCVSGKWQCTDRVCAGICSAWGDSHYKTFDGKIYDFQGTCDYVLAKGSISKEDSFDVMTQNVPCSSSGVTCSKSVSLNVGRGSKQETITFTKDKPIPIFTGLERITVREAGLFTYAEVFDLGLVLQWDRGTRVYVKIDPKWKNKLKGLCGNYNDNELDDFETPSGGVSEVSATLFGDSWRLQTYCPETRPIQDSCVILPGRKTWAVQKCGILKSEVFEPCHSEVPLDPYLERCIFDTCACDLGGDCECLCTAIAAYAQECNIRGVPIKWRHQALCPIQCDEKCARYSPCVATCPKQTCDNQFIHSALTKLCAEDACVEGCEIDPCPEGQIRVNITSLECVPIASCKTTCMQIGDVTYFEGDKMEEDDCHTCFCSHHKKTCTGVPCPSPTPPSQTLPNIARLEGCRSGWSSWFDSYRGKGTFDEEPVPTMLQMHKVNSPAFCDLKDMSGISCRVVGTHESATDIGQNVSCSLRGGLSCHGRCHDFEIRVLCDCEPATTLAPSVGMCADAHPNKEHPDDCHKFMECVNTAEGPQVVVKTCGPHMMYNPHTYTCDWPATVAAIKPQCGVVETKPTEAPETCTDGWSSWLDTPTTPDGDYELLDNYQKLRTLPCGHEHITDIECKYYKNIPVKAAKGVKGGRKKRVLKDHTESGDVVSCSPSTGLSCSSHMQADGRCEDYQIRVFCQCHPSTTVLSTQPEVVQVCPPGLVWDDCAIMCTQVCHFFDFYLKKTGACRPNEPCVPGCKDPGLGRCPAGSMWRDKQSCVRVHDCTCRSDTGEIVKPGQVHHVSDCEMCQCIDNEYVCDASACDEEVTLEVGEDEERTMFEHRPIHVENPGVDEQQKVDTLHPATTAETLNVTATHVCEDDKYTYEVEVLSPDAMTASSVLNSMFAPYHAKLNSLPSPKSGGSWIPKDMDQHQFLQVDLGEVEPVFGVVVQGSPLADDYVSTYNVLVSSDGQRFNYVRDRNGQPAVFQGPTDGNTPRKQMFAEPVEGRHVKFVPLTFNEAIAMRVEVIGCGHPVTTLPPIPTTERQVTLQMGSGRAHVLGEDMEHVCEDDSYRYEVELLPPSALTASSERSPKFAPTQAKLNNKQSATHGGSWVAKATDGDQYLQVDLGRPEPVFGVVVQGSPLTNEFVTSYRVDTSMDGELFHPITDPQLEPVVFEGPSNNNTPMKQMFDQAVEAQFVRFVPVTFHGAIAMRVEVIGCGPPVTTPAPIIIVSTTETPPALCEDDMFTYEVKKLPPEALTASSEFSPQYAPRNARLNGKVSPSSAGSWVPHTRNRDQFLQVDLGRAEPVYGVVVQGSPTADEFVTSYKVLTSNDGVTFTYVTDVHKQPAVFRGPINGNTPVKQLFSTPVEARFVRFNPLTFHDTIAMRVEVIGCGEGVTTELPFIATTVTVPVLCDDKMGVENGEMSDQQISVSSVLHGDVARFGPQHMRPGGTGWLPNNKPKQWIKFDFLEPRNITGVVTHGTDKGWVEAFTAKYSHDNDVWNPILDDNYAEKVFLANFDDETPATNMFEYPIQARYLKLIPSKWHDKVALTAEVLGCFHPYPEVTTVMVEVEAATTPPPIPPECHLCPGQPNSLLEMTGDACSCSEKRFWDGENCVTALECPCYVGHIPYAVGTVYESEDCEQCVCKVGGTSECSKKVCEKCAAGLRSVKTPNCGCICKPCEEGTVLCPTTDICIEEYFWCDGIMHCPDDETNCTVATEEPSTTTLPTTTVETIVMKSCPTMSCPKGFIPVVKKKTELELQETAEQSSLYGVKGRKTKGGVKGGRTQSRRPLPAKLTAPPQDEECPLYECMSPRKTMSQLQTVQMEVPCPKAECGHGFKLVYMEGDITQTVEPCPKFKCEPVIPEAICNVTERNFRTFDGTEFKYDICNHVIARDLDENQKWQIDMSKDCSVFDCKKLVTISQNGVKIVLLPDLTVKYGDYVYSVDQVRKIGDLEHELQVSRSGDVLIVQSEVYGFWLMWDPLFSLKVSVPGNLINHVEGLCGYFSGRPEDDKRKPDGQPARTSVEFGDAWANEEKPENCEPLRCPIHVQNKALQMCYVVKEKPFSRCQELMNVDRFVSSCIESACTCLSAMNETDAEACRCKLLLNFVTECAAEHPMVDLSTWRVDHNCPVDCKDTFKDCHRQPCELSCDRLQEEDPCPLMEKTCFPGCFCPDGLVRKGQECVKPMECRDCVCESFGDPQYMTFDRSNFTFNGNCTYIASQDISPTGEHEYQVLETNSQCHDKPDSTCTESVTVLYKGHKIHVRREEEGNELEALVDGEKVREFPMSNKWLQLEAIPNKEVAILIRPIQLEVTFFFNNYAFVVRLPSRLFGGKTEGLCGNCNRDKSDDFLKRDGEQTEDINEFGLSWLEKGDREEHCATPVRLETCVPLPPDEDPCLKLLDPARFGKCHFVVDPVPYLSACQLDICHSNDTMVSACRDLEAYARDCLREGLCVDWRSDDLCPFTCSADLEYQACGSGCEETCENFEELRNNPLACSFTPGDGCFCPEGLVLHNGTCVPEKVCVPCDDEGHFSGDVWSPDKCRTCACEGRTRTCNTTDCAAVETVCELGMTAVEQPGHEDECCAKYLCVPVPTVGPTCPEPQQPECGLDQVLKLESLPNGCSSFICECKPAEDCEEYGVSLEVDAAEAEPPLAKGFVRNVNMTGCCPHVKIVCHPELCPAPKQCRQHYELIMLPVVKDACCPEHACELPKNVCLYEFEHKTDASGQEIDRKADEKFSAIKEPGSMWRDGPCHECTCTGSRPGEYRAVCSVETCPDLEALPDALSYVLKPVSVPDKCCPNIKRTACIVNGTIVEIGSQVSDSPCETYVCNEVGDEPLIEKTVQRCNTNCQMGEKYEPATEESGECCGSCKQVDCVVDGELHEVGSTWQSDDHCLNFFCVSANGSVFVETVKTMCPKVPAELLEDFELNYEPVVGECCKLPVKVACMVNETTYQPGQMWSHPGDRCTNVSCVKTPSGDLLKQELTQTCNTDCDQGWEYLPSPEDSPHCCGKCVQVACLVEGVPYRNGVTWHSDDNCTTFECNHEFQVNIMMAQCPYVDDCPPENLYQDGCCKKCRLETSNLNMCGAEDLPEETTVGLIQEVVEGRGICTNKSPISNFKDCLGMCQSSTYYDAVTSTHENKCHCCQATEMTHLNVILHCEDGHSIRKVVPIPRACSCEACVEAKSNIMKIHKGVAKTKGGVKGRKGYDSDIYRLMKHGE